MNTLQEGLGDSSTAEGYLARRVMAAFTLASLTVGTLVAASCGGQSPRQNGVDPANNVQPAEVSPPPTALGPAGT